MLAGLAAGAVLLPAVARTPGLAVEQHERLDPAAGGAGREAVSGALHPLRRVHEGLPEQRPAPAFAEAGLEGIWTPVLVPRIGYCEPSCMLCGQVCPTGAIWEFTLPREAWVAEPAEPGAPSPIRLGTAFYDRGRCLPWAMATDCIVCEEWCPTSPKADLSAAGRGDRCRRKHQAGPAAVHRSRSLCVGCGACEYACPVRDRPAVYVTSVGESRSKTNQILLQRAAKAASCAAGERRRARVDEEWRDTPL